MLRNYIIVAFRNLFRQIYLTLINISGVSIGFAVVILLFLFVSNELSYNKLHSNYDQIYRFVTDIDFGGKERFIAPNSLGTTAQHIDSVFEEVEASCRFFTEDFSNKRNDNNISENINVYYADSTFFTLFSFPLIYGDSLNILNKPNHVAISHSLAKKQFGNINPLNKSIALNNKVLIVSGVFKDIPNNSDLKFDALISFITFDPSNIKVTQRSLDFETFILFKENANTIDLIKKVSVEGTKLAKVRFAMENAKIEVFLQPLADIHLKSDFLFQISGHGEIFDVYFFLFLGIFILITSIINYINLLSTSQMNRLKEIGIRKTLGAEKSQIQMQFVIESIIYILIALILAIVIVEIVADPFGKLVGKEFPLDYRRSFIVNVAILITALIISIFSGLFPHFLISRFKTADILKIIGLRKGYKLVKSFSILTQFTITIFFISILVIMNLQSSFIENKDLRFNKENVIYIDELSSEIQDNFKPIRDRLIQHVDISALSLSDFVPGSIGAITSIEHVNNDTLGILMINEFPADEYFVDAYDIKIKLGRNFHTDSINDTKAILLNEKAFNLLGNSAQLQDSFQVWKNRYKLIGVVEDFHFKSLHDSVSPLILSKFRTIGRKMSVRIKKSADYKNVIDTISKTILTYDPDFAFNYELISDNIDDLYTLESKNKNLIFYLSIIAVIISSIGLYSFVSFIVIQRTKEIGIRKVLGEEPYSIIFMIMKESAYWIFLANLIALPLAYFAAVYWLNTFAYHVEYYVFVIIITAASLFMVSLITIYFQTRKIAFKNPVFSLRYE